MGLVLNTNPIFVYSLDPNFLNHRRLAVNSLSHFLTLGLIEEKAIFIEETRKTILQNIMYILIIRLKERLTFFSIPTL